MCRYWDLLELLCEKFDGTTTTFVFPREVFRDLWGHRNYAQSRRFADAVTTLKGCSIVETGLNYVCDFPILLELLDRDFRKTRKVRANDAPKNKNKNKNKIKEEKEKQDMSNFAEPLALVPPPPPEKNFLTSAWNEHCTNFSKVREPVSSARLKKIKSRLAENPETGDWLKALKKINASSFCTGHNDRGWKASFDWLLKNDTLEKVLEGKYDDREQNRKGIINGHIWQEANESADISDSADGEFRLQN